MSNLRYLLSQKWYSTLGKVFNSVSLSKANSFCKSCLSKHVPFSRVNESPKNNKSLLINFPMNIIITPRSNKTNFHNNCNSIKSLMMTVTITYHTLLIQNITILVDQCHFRLSKLFGKFRFAVIGLSEHKIRSNVLINSIIFPDYIFCENETKNTHGGNGLYVNVHMVNIENLMIPIFF